LLNLQEIHLLITRVETEQRGYAITGNELFLRNFNKARTRLPKFIRQIDKMEIDSWHRLRWGEIKFNIDQKVNFATKVIVARQKEGFQASIKLIQGGEGNRLMDLINSEMNEIVLKLRQDMMEDYRSSLQTSRYLTIGIIIGLMTCFALLMAATVLLIKSIYKLIKEISRAVQVMGDGDFTVKIPIYRNDELGLLSKTINSLSSKILNLMNVEKKLSGVLEDLAFTTANLGSSAILHSSDVSKILQEIVDKARFLVKADYAALGIGTDPNHSFDPWVYSGINEEVKQKIGKYPRPVGLLGWVAIQGEPTRLEDMKKNPLFQGFPEGHPAMGPLLGVPIRSQGKSIGNLYLSRNDGANFFTEVDQKVISLLTYQVGVILENVTLQSELKEAVSSREEVLAVVSHDLRSPLTVINMSAEMLLRKVAQNHELKWVNDTALKIEAASNRMNRMISDLLDVSAIESGKIQINLEPFEVHELLNEIKTQFSPIIKERRINFEIEQPQGDVVVLGDADRIHQVFSNLIGNAVKFTPQDGHITVRSKFFTGRIQFTVSDTGPGISEDNQKYLFDRYWQVEGTKAKGAGLGLYISKGIIDAHDGKLEVKSTLGKGTTFYFDIPLLNASETQIHH